MRQRVCVEGRQFAMMAAQGCDVPWIRWSYPVIFFVVAASGSRNGMLSFDSLNRVLVCCRVDG